MTKSEQAEATGEAANPTIPSAPPTLRPRDVMLLDFLREHDAACPVCGYNVRALTRPICPECRQELTLTVGAAKLRLGWLFVALAPGFFSGIAAVFAIMPVVGQYLGDRRLSLGVLTMIALDLFGWCSLIFAIMLAANLKRFLAQPRARQRWFALVTWIVHITALGLFIFFAATYL